MPSIGNPKGSHAQQPPSSVVKYVVRAVVGGVICVLGFYATTGPKSFNIPAAASSSTTAQTSSLRTTTSTVPVVEVFSSSSASTYQPAPVEAYLMSHAEELKFTAKPPEYVTTCTIWKDPNATPYHPQLLSFANELKDYYQRIKSFQMDASVPTDLRESIRANNTHDVCQHTELHPDGLKALFAGSGQLSQTTSVGYIEPLLPPMRHPGLCLEENVGVGGQKMDVLLSLDYLVHDWGEMCRKLKPHSRTVLVDMGASLTFFGGINSPTLDLVAQYRKFGFVFDHIYAYELRQTPADMVYTRLPSHLQSAYHWINMGVSSGPDDKCNPFRMLLDNFNEDDLIVVKLDIDSPGIERQLASQLDADPKLQKLIDQFYFEHHVNQDEIKNHWGPTTESVQESFDLFTSLRKQGVPAHFWV